MSESISHLTLSALAEIRNHLVIQAKSNIQTENIYPDSYVYAISKSLHPISEENIYYDENERLLSHPFQEIYKITYKEVEDVKHYLIEKWHTRTNIKFRDLEKYYTSILTFTDVESYLIKICRYLYLSNNFDKQFWHSFVLNHNDRVLQIKEDFRISEVFPFSNY